MKKKLLLILFFTISAYMLACSPIFYNYQKINGKIYFGSYNNPFEVTGADTLSFISISSIYAKDKDHVYFSGHVLPKANPITFEFLGGVKTLTDDIGYSKDDKSVFYLDSVINNANPESFKIIEPIYNFAGEYEDGYAKDENHIYRNGIIMPFDVNTFQIMGWGYTLDKNGIYHSGELLKGVDINNYKQDVMFLSSDKVYMNGKELKGLHAPSFDILNIDMAEQTSCGGIWIKYILLKDKNGVYLNNIPLRDVDVNTFVKENNYLYKDKNGYYTISEDNKKQYELRKLLLHPNSQKIRMTNESGNFVLYNDDTTVYLTSSKWNFDNIENLSKKYNVDASTFEVYVIWGDNILFKDKNQFYVKADWNDALKIIPIDSNGANIIYANYRINFIVKDSVLYSVGKNGYKSIEIDPETIISVDPDNELKEKGYTSDMIVDKNYIYKTSKLQKEKLKEGEYDLLKKCMVPYSKTEESRVYFLKQQLDKAKNITPIKRPSY